MYPASSTLIDRVLKKTHTQRVRIESLTPALTSMADLSPVIVGGEVQVKKSNEGARTFQLTVVNPDGQYTPRTYDDPFQITRKVRIWRGVVLGPITEWVPLGTFQVTRVKPRLRYSEQVLDIAGIDLWFRMATLRTQSTFTVAAGTSIENAVKAVLALAGLTHYVIDPTLSGLPAGHYTQATVWQAGTAPSLIMEQLLGDSGAWGQFDPLGVYVVRSFDAMTSISPVLSLVDTMPGITSIDPSSEDSPEITNDVIVASNSPNVSPFQVEVYDDTPGSLTSIYGPFGRRTTYLADEAISNAAVATEVANEMLYNNSYGAMPLDMDSAPLPFLDAGDVVSLSSIRLGLGASPYIIDNMVIPLVPGTQNTHLLSVRDLG